jgi:hypothetical protein
MCVWIVVGKKKSKWRRKLMDEGSYFMSGRERERERGFSLALRGTELRQRPRNVDILNRW